MKQEETRKKLTPQPYDFDFNEYGTENPYQQDFVADLEDMDYQLTLSDMEYLQIDPRDMDRCGETCQSAHRRLRNRRKGSEAIKAFADGTNSRYSDLQKKMQENGKQYLNAENLALAEKMKKVGVMVINGNTITKQGCWKLWKMYHLWFHKHQMESHYTNLKRVEQH